MKPVFRRVLGFGPWGWGLLPVAAALAFCAFGGFDLRHAILRFLWEWQGESFVWRLIRDLLFGAYGASMAGVVCGPLTLIWMLVAMHVAPRAWAWWQWAIVTMWLTFNPYLCLKLAGALPTRLIRFLGWFPQPGAYVTATDVLAVVLVQLGLLAFTVRCLTGPLRAPDASGRTWWRFAPTALWIIGATLGTLAWASDGLANSGSSLYFTRWGYLLIGVLWHVSTVVLAVGASLAARRRAHAESWRCTVCGYDLRGMRSPDSRCPECGRSPATATSPETPSPG